LYPIGKDKIVSLYDRTADKVVAKMTGHKKDVLSVKIVANGERDIMLSCGADKICKVWEPKGDKYAVAHNITTHTSDVTGCSVHATGDYFATCSYDKSWAFHNIETGKTLLNVTDKSVEKGFGCMCLHPDGLILSTGTQENLVRMWDLKSQSNVATFEGHTKDVTSVSFSENGYHMASGSADGTVRLWDLRKLKNIKILELGKEPVNTVTFDKSGQHLACGAGNELKVYICICICVYMYTYVTRSLQRNPNKSWVFFFCVSQGIQSTVAIPPLTPHFDTHFITAWHTPVPVIKPCLSSVWRVVYDMLFSYAPRLFEYVFPSPPPPSPLCLSYVAISVVITISPPLPSSEVVFREGMGGYPHPEGPQWTRHRYILMHIYIHIYIYRLSIYIYNIYKYIYIHIYIYKYIYILFIITYTSYSRCRSLYCYPMSFSPLPICCVFDVFCECSSRPWSQYYHPHPVALPSYLSPLPPLALSILAPISLFFPFFPSPFLLPSSSPPPPPPPPPPPIEGACFSLNSQYLASTSMDRSLKFFGKN
jgi:hypothetical protein